MDIEEKLQRWIDALAQFDVWESACEFYKDNEAELVEMNKTQLRMCLTSDRRLMKGILYNRAFFRTGAFYAGITIVTDPEAITFISTDPKWDHKVEPEEGWEITLTPLIGRFGPSMLGVPEQKEAEVDERRNTTIGDKLHLCFE